ncbi:RsmB/NOP family class I SAM-dependent RNA methyltransferase [Lentzea sp. NPDC051213]|uniref:RsmB/NOP family class I SAM-dependent RNA methyltransferase n=1 Tax=Lentzea sp. NPDC051213 TaxID=3364126 RepID=UPI00378C8918
MTGYSRGASKPSRPSRPHPPRRRTGPARPPVEDPARLAALETLRAVRQRDAYANLVLPQMLRDRRITGRDAALATELTYGAARAQGLLDAVIEACSDRPLSEVDGSALDALRLGTYQLLRTRIPSHAAVASTVDLVRAELGSGIAGFVNAVLRKVSERDEQTWVNELAPDAETDPVGHLAFTHAHPRWIAQAFAEALGSREEPLKRALEADDTRPVVHLVARPGEVSADELAAITGGDVAPYSPYGVHLEQGAGDPADLEPVRERLANVQDEGSQLCALALTRAPLLSGDESATAGTGTNVSSSDGEGSGTAGTGATGSGDTGTAAIDSDGPGSDDSGTAHTGATGKADTGSTGSTGSTGTAGTAGTGSDGGDSAGKSSGGTDDRWLDLCAGPGGKAALLAALVGIEGGELIAVEKAPHRAELVRKITSGLPVTVHVADGRETDFLEGAFDRVLVDAPCTGLGALRRRPEARWRRQPADVGTLTKLQRELLTEALRLVRPGGVVGYVVCSPHLSETVGIVTDIARRTGAEVLDAREFFPGVPDLGEGPHVQLWPHLHGTDAMFCAMLRRPVRALEENSSGEV